MRVAALVSDVVSHLDFGGTGYRMLARAFSDKGHDVIWMASERMLPILRKAGFSVLHFPTIDRLALTGDMELREDEILGELLRRNAVDAVLSDRRLPRVQQVTQRLGLPLVAIGTPGGAWAFGTGQDGAAEFGPVEDDTASIWIDSALFNVVFMPRQFFGEIGSGEVIAIGHSDRTDPPPVHGRDTGRVSVTTGSGGDLQAVAAILAAIRKDVRIEVFHPPVQAFLANEVVQRIQRLGNVELRGWVDLRTGINPSTFMINLGGIASVWRAFSDGLPQICCPGLRGEQAFNARQVQESGIGVTVPPEGEADWMARPYEFMADNYDRFRSAMVACRRTCTDDLNSAVDKIAAAV